MERLRPGDRHHRRRHRGRFRARRADDGPGLRAVRVQEGDSELRPAGRLAARVSPRENLPVSPRVLGTASCTRAPEWNARPSGGAPARERGSRPAADDAMTYLRRDVACLDQDSQAAFRAQWTRGRTGTNKAAAPA